MGDGAVGLVRAREISLFFFLSVLSSSLWGFLPQASGYTGVVWGKKVALVMSHFVVKEKKRRRW